MSTPKYFRNFPNIKYAVSANKAGIATYINIKDYFNLLKVREDIFREETLYTPYTIHNGQRPEQISEAIYGDAQFYWVILQINEITDYYSQWPLSELELTEFVYEKYGGASKAGEIHHWQTMETYDQSDPPNMVLPGQLEVPSNFKFSYPAEPGSNVKLSTTPYSVSNFDYERDLNEEKSQINLLDKKYIYDYEREVRKYAENLNPRESFVDIADVMPQIN
tara:strand:+ start:396 stop:1058 length:663 start_codon:yes stop_codon:yes gene_type:complete